jgi:hypothetical protein
MDQNFADPSNPGDMTRGTEYCQELHADSVHGRQSTAPASSALIARPVTQLFAISSPIHSPLSAISRNVVAQAQQQRPVKQAQMWLLGRRAARRQAGHRGP